MTILHFDASINGQNSASRVVSRSIVEQISKSDPRSKIIYRDLAADPLPYLTLEAFADTSVLEEFLGAETIVIGAPMYNFTLPTQLKAWLDRIVVADKTFRYTPNGPEGLCGGKWVMIALARGGYYDPTSVSAALEHLESYLRGVFDFIGIDPLFIAADGLAIGPDERERSITKALGETVLLAPDMVVAALVNFPRDVPPRRAPGPLVPPSSALELSDRIDPSSLSRVGSRQGEVEMAELSGKQRDGLDENQFAFPKERKEPLNSASHVRNAIARFDQVKGVSDHERDAAWARIKRAADKFGVDVSEKSWRELGKKS